MHTVLQSYFQPIAFHRSTFTRAEYHNNSYSHEKTQRCNRYAGAQFNTTVIIPAVYYIKNDLVAIV